MPAKIKPRSSKDSRKPGKGASSGVSKPSVKTKSKEAKLEARKLAEKTVAPALGSGSASDDEEKDEVVEESGDEGEDEDEENEDEDEGIDEEGMKRLMKALGEDGLDDIGHMQLDVLEGKDEEDGSEGQDVEDGEQSESEAEAEAQKSSDEHGEPGGEEEDVALEDAESVDEDAVPRQKITTNNKIALERIHDSIKLDPSISWTETLTVTYPETIDVDVNDDINRELAFYKQALHGATTARALAASHNLPFTRPQDYFAEMVKSDAHMERIRQRLLDESATLKQAEERRKEREGKKYGKQVQIEKLKERERRKKEMDERLKGLKRKNKDVLDDTQAGDDAFDVAVEDAIADRPSKRSKPSDPKSKSKLPRKARDSKFGFGGGKGRRDKQNTRESTEKFDYGAGSGSGGGRKGAGKGPGAKKGGPPKRLGKSRRTATRK